MRIKTNVRRALTTGISTLALAALCSVSGSAAAVTDPANDILPTFSGSHTDGDLDVLSANVTLQGSNLAFTGTLREDAEFENGEQYVFGINRGQGSAKFANIANPGVLFDTTVVIKPGGGSVVNDLISNSTTAISHVTVSENTFTGIVPLSDLPSEGFTATSYTYNLWSETTPGNAGNTNIADFAPNNTVAPLTSGAVAATPEPGTIGMLSVGAIGAIAMVRRRKSV
jgi:PEP-CTERM motif